MKVYLYKNDLGIDIQEVFIFDLVKDKMEEYCLCLVELVVEVDDVLMEKYLEGEELIVDELVVGLCWGIIVGIMVLVFCGFVFKNKGV